MMTKDQRDEQRREALAKANHVRWARAYLRRQVKDGEVLLGELLRDPPECLLNMRVLEMLMWMRGFGTTKAKLTLRRLGLGGQPVSVGVTLAQLSQERRRRLLEIVELREKPARVAA